MTVLDRRVAAVPLFVLCVALANVSPAQVSEGPIPVTVIDFTASRDTPYRFSVPEFVVDELVNSGEFDVLERDKPRTVVGEIAFQTGAGLVRPDSAVEVGRMLGARLIVTGHIIEHGHETKTFSGYNISTSTTTWRLKTQEFPLTRSVVLSGEQEPRWSETARPAGRRPPRVVAQSLHPLTSP